jgi:hypothetical protein
MEMIDSLAGAEDVRHGCQLILDWLVGRKARDERSTNGMMGWLAGVQGRKEITTLPRGQGVAIVQQIKAVEAHHRALRARQSDLIRALETLIRLLERHEPGRNIIHFKAK